MSEYATMLLGSGTLGRVAGSAANQQRSAVQGLFTRGPVVQRNVTAHVATGPRPAAGGVPPKPVQINLRDEGFDGVFPQEPACGAVGQHAAAPVRQLHPQQYHSP